MGDLFEDLKHGVRVLLARPAFTLVALLALALGIGANSAIFSVVRGVLLEPLPYAHPGRLVMLWHTYGSILPKASLSVPAYLEYRDHVAAFESVAAGTPWSANLTGTGTPERIQGARVTANFLRTVGVTVARGRDFLDQEDRPGGDRVVLISDGLWRRRFGADPGLVGRTIALNGEAHTVVGILPKGFVFFRPADLFKPIAFTPEQRDPKNHGFEYLLGVARLRPGVGLAAARSEVDALAARLRTQYYDSDWGVLVNPLIEEMVGDVRPALLVLLGAVACVLLIACANVANLLLARATSRRKEIALRLALGAGRGRIVRQLLTESAVLGVAGGALGLLVAYAGIRLLLAAAPVRYVQPILGGRHVGLDGAVLAFTLGLSILTGLLFGAIPALQASRADLHGALKEGGRGDGLGERGRRLLGGFVVAQVAVALVLLVGAGLLVRSLGRLRGVDPGFRAAGVLTFKVALPETRYRERVQVEGLYEALLPRLEALPGVTRAAVISNLPMSGDNSGASFVIEGRPVPPGAPGPHGDTHYVSPGYFETMGIPLLRGRLFDARDGRDATPVVLIDQELATRHFRGEDPVGHRIAKAGEGTAEQPLWRTIVGVVGHVSKYALDGRVKEQYYMPAAQKPPRTTSLVLRTAGDPLALVPSVRAAVRAVDPDLPLYDVKSMPQVVEGTLVTRRFVMLLLSLFAILALVLAGVGLYGVLSYAVGQRAREIGVRMALGARAGQVVGMVVRQGMALAAAGLVLGAGLALVFTRALAGLLYGVTAADPLTYVALAAILGAVALVACVVPARRAARVDPMVALRDE